MSRSLAIRVLPSQIHTTVIRAVTAMSKALDGVACGALGRGLGRQAVADGGSVALMVEVLDGQSPEAMGAGDSAARSLNRTLVGGAVAVLVRKPAAVRPKIARQLLMEFRREDEVLDPTALRRQRDQDLRAAEAHPSAAGRPA
ncbi:MAG: hypothetical protein HYY16_17675 [Planctomycetes bacterium]|nr:hypothetical protein [Planctomycetota bacterium]